MPRGAFTAGLLVALALAGCLGPNDAPTPAKLVCDNRTGSCPPPAPPPGAVAGPVDPADNASFGLPPVWNVGDWWSYKVSGGTTFQVAVAAVGATYTVLPTDNRSALMEALFDFSTVGNIGTDLSGEQYGSRVKYFDFPLEENKTWGLSVDGHSLRATAKIDRNEWLITANDHNSTQLVYRYSPAARWFTSIEWRYQGLTAQLDRSGTDFSGTVYRAALDPKLTYTTGGTPASSFTIGQGVSSVAVKYEWSGNQGFAGSARFVDPRNTANVPFPDFTCTGPCEGSGVVVYPGTPGTWAATVSSTPQGTLRLTAYAVTDVAQRLG